MTSIIKHITLLATITAMPICLFANDIKVEVDEIHELNSIVWRLAGAKEYNQCYIKSYANDIDEYFSKYKDHQLIHYCKKLREQQYVSHDAIYFAGSFTNLDNGIITICDGYTADSLASIDNRWTAETYEQYINLLNDFYKESDFHSFFNSQQALYDGLVMELDSIMDKNVDFNWFSDFFGKELPEMKVYISPNNGSSNYGLSLNVPACRRGILIGVLALPDGTPRFSGMVAETIIHEVTHAYTNALIDKYSEQFDDHIDLKLYGYAMNTFYEYGVGTGSLLYEWLTRLCVLYYQKEHQTNDVPIEYFIGMEMKNGFIWMDKSFSTLDSLMNIRKTGEYIEDLTPQLINDLNLISENFASVIDGYEKQRPYIVKVIPTPGTNLDLQEDFVTFTICFSEDMYSNASGAQMLYENATPTKCNEEGIFRGWVGARTFQMTYPTECLKDMRIYGFILNSEYMQDIYGFHMKGENTFIYGIPEDTSCK